MQATASRSGRALKALASKLHPSLPLTPRESAQLLALLTSSFRAHLDRAHPGTPSAETKHASKPFSSKEAPLAPAISSHVSATRHIDSILTNPLFAVQPHPRGTDARSPQTHDPLDDPVSWFMNQAAMGAVTPHKAAFCLRTLQIKRRVGALSGQSCARAVVQIANWLETTDLLHEAGEVKGIDNLLFTLVAMLMQEGETAKPWAWFADIHNIRRGQILKAMVRAEAKSGPYLDKALSRFLAACKSGHHQDHIKHTRALQPAGAHLERLLVCDRRPVESVELYEAFIQSLRIWTKNHCCTHEAALWLHHPTAPKVDPAIDLIRAGTMAKEINKASLGKRKRCVEICLETARQCLAKEQFHDAQFVLEFARDNFPDLLDTDGQLALPTESNDAKREQKEMREREEDVNLRLLDRLLPT